MCGLVSSLLTAARGGEIRVLFICIDLNMVTRDAGLEDGIFLLVPKGMSVEDWNTNFTVVANGQV